MTEKDMKGPIRELFWDMVEEAPLVSVITETTKEEVKRK